MLVVVVVQVLLALTLLVAATVALRHGGSAQAAAEAEVQRQGFDAGLLARHRIRHAETTAESLLPFGIAGLLVVLAALNTQGAGLGRAATWVVTPVLLLAGSVITGGQVFADRYVEASLRRSDEASGIDAQAVNAAAKAQFPSWLRALVVTRFTLVSAGSVAILVTLSTNN